VISVLCPSRGRPDLLLASIASLTDRADGDVEVLVGADGDDDATLDLMQDGFWPDHARLWVSQERFGYSGLHLYYNALALMAKGEWLMIWNDDARMLTAGWDLIIAEQSQAVLWPGHNDQPHCNIFPVWPRAWTEQVGHVSLSPCVDSWMQEIGQYLGRQVKVGVEILHDCYRLTGNNNDLTLTDAGAHFAHDNSSLFWAMRSLWQADAEKIRMIL
jgi:hypothetical protein